ncbi:MAG TPA: tryptophan--tRNA ligase [Planctomycetes bacterium]|nr:tryptophan--tRNA ligase [Planctomycetota bacterium]
MRILSGVQPSGELHLGNYFGAIRQHLELQHEGDALYFIADYHALTTVQDRERLSRLTREVAASYLALGLDPAKATFFRQSDVPEVHELTWMLESVTGMGLLERAHSYKDKVARGLRATVGLFAYPALMASDILIYGSNLVPVGKDQVQHIEIAQDMAQSFNAAFSCEVLLRPEYRLSPTPKVPGTDGQKMSKSYGNTIPIFASGKKLKKAINAIVTDSRDPKLEALDPDSCNAFAIFSLFADEAEQKELAQAYREDRTFLGYGVTKKRIKELMDEHFGPARERFAELLKPKSELDDVLEAGGKRARALAQETMSRAREAVGMTQRPVQP